MYHLRICVHYLRDQYDVMALYKCPVYVCVCNDNNRTNNKTAFYSALRNSSRRFTKLKHKRESLKIMK